MLLQCHLKIHGVLNGKQIFPQKTLPQSTKLTQKAAIDGFSMRNLHKESQHTALADD